MDRRLHWTVALLCAVAASTGCVAQPDQKLVHSVYNGQYSEARVYMQDNLAKRSGSGEINRNYMLDRMRLMLATLADGYTVQNDRVVSDVFDTLATQGINRDKTVQSVVVNEDLKIWKGEPFEQALTLHYIATHWAMQGSWENARAAIKRSLFHLKDFGGSEKEPMGTGELVRRAAKKGKDSDYLSNGYVAEESDFTLGYLMTAIANHQMALKTGDPNRLKEAKDNYQRAVSLRPELKELVGRLKKPESYNTIFVVDFGRGPKKIATGPDNAIAKFVPKMPSDQRRLVVSNSDGKTAQYPLVCDVNRMATDHRWNNLQDVRLAKSYIGSALVAGGAAATAYGVSEGSEAATYAGLAAMAAGAFAKAGAHADTRYCELIPQRVYVVPAKVRSQQTRVTLKVQNAPQSKLVLTGIEPPADDAPAKLRYARLVSFGRSAPKWATSGKIYYSNERTGEVDRGIHAPYILGGTSVLRPTEEVLTSYQRAGHLQRMSLSDLEQLYRQEKIELDARQGSPFVGRHVLEGGASLVPPVPGTAGFARLFGQTHPRYEPRTAKVRKLSERLRSRMASEEVAELR